MVLDYASMMYRPPYPAGIPWAPVVVSCTTSRRVRVARMSDEGEPVTASVQESNLRHPNNAQLREHHDTFLKLWSRA